MTAASTSHVDLPITGMTCASCATRIERRLNKLDGVEATVNYATGQASVDFDTVRISTEHLIDAVESTGYGASLPNQSEEGSDGDEEIGRASWRERV